jgi:hypothetical protein
MIPLGGPVRLPTTVGRSWRQAVRVTVCVRRRVRDVAVRVVLDPTTEQAAAMAWEHRVHREFGDMAAHLTRRGTIRRNPVVGVLHRDPVTVPGAIVTVSRYVEQAVDGITAQRWGETLALLHVLGSTPRAQRLMQVRPVTNTLVGLTADALLAAIRRPGHPLHGRPEVVALFAHALRERALHAVRLDPNPVLAHRDLHALNCVNGPTGGMAIDWQETAWGNRSADFAWLHLQVRRYGGSPALLETARDAYARVAPRSCPTPEQITAAGQVRELVFLGFSILNADRGPEHRDELLVELPILHDPDAATGRWRMLFNPAVFQPGLVA